METNNRPFTSELLRLTHAVQDGDQQSVLRAVRRNNWMISIDLKDAYLQVPVHPDSRRFLRFVVDGKVYQFKALCFDLSTAPQVFTRVMASVSAMFHDLGVRILRYLDDWLVLASSKKEALWAREVVLNRCHQLGIVVNLAMSHLNPSHTATYLGMSCCLAELARSSVVSVCWSQGVVFVCGRFSSNFSASGISRTSPS